MPKKGKIKIKRGKRRHVWLIRPTDRVKESDKVYRRAREKDRLRHQAEE